MILTMSDDPPARRPLKSRGTRWAGLSARLLLRAGFTPNGVSVASMGFALAAAVCFYYAPLCGGGAAAALWVGAAFGIQGRLWCNLMDGMLAVEGGLKSPLGGVYNEVPDRIADILILVGAGLGAAHAFPWAAHAGYAAALAAVTTAYIRAMGASLTGGVHDFRGPMAKPHRMALMTGACLAALVEQLSGRVAVTVAAALVAVAVLSAFTCVRRLRGLAALLRKSSAP